ncbi:TniQ family protein [Streptomyces zaomyceticus]|uniref:TniQ family protein n=1 Tax=Streptomyces zaomyceticus TaxID=68286 RepID=UPI0033B33F74
MDTLVARTVRRLPVVPLPLPREALLSWLDHVAAECELDRVSMAGVCGLLGAGEGAARVSAAGRRSAVFGLSDTAAQRVPAATGLLADEIQAMTWMRFARTALPASAAGVISEEKFSLVKSSWIDPVELRFCPGCVNERGGRWPLDWSTPWAFACLRHGCYLLAACSICREPVRAGEVRLGPDRCRGFVRDAYGTVQRCGSKFRNMVAPPLSDVLLEDLQELLYERLQIRGQEMVSARGVFADLAAAAEFAWFLATPDFLTGADAVVRERFVVFSRRYPAAPGRNAGRKDRVTYDPLVRTACLRIASQIVFSADPWTSAMDLVDFAARPTHPSVKPLRRAWLKRPPSDTTPRMARIVNTVRVPVPPTRGSVSSTAHASD